MNYTGERVVPWNLAMGMTVMSCHVARYAWAVRHVFGGTVGDLGCGCGYGSFMLSWACRRVVGVDVSAEAVGFARAHFRADNLSFETGDVCAPLDLGCDIYVAFEVLEHLDNPTVVRDHYRPLLWSIPVNEGSRFHKRAYSLSEIDALMGEAYWLQASNGYIRERAWHRFQPAFALGLSR